MRWVGWLVGGGQIGREQIFDGIYVGKMKEWRIRFAKEEEKLKIE